MNEELMGLAAMQGLKQDPMRDIQEIVRMLEQGMSPEELVQRGVPRELVAQAIEMLNNQVQQVEEPGLAGMYTQSGM